MDTSKQMFQYIAIFSAHLNNIHSFIFSCSERYNFLKVYIFFLFWNIDVSFMIYKYYYYYYIIMFIIIIILFFVMFMYYL